MLELWRRVCRTTTMHFLYYVQQYNHRLPPVPGTSVGLLIYMALRTWQCGRWSGDGPYYQQSFSPDLSRRNTSLTVHSAINKRSINFHRHSFSRKQQERCSHTILHSLQGTRRSQPFSAWYWTDIMETNTNSTKFI
jgi:hypothetical protein